MIKMEKRVELLLPVGGLKQLVAAVENGADAVYLGGQAFSARQYADNFSDDGLKEAIEYAHIRGVQVYLTMNTLISDQELQQALNEVGKAYEAGIDALIVQDLGFAHQVRAYLPDLHIHMSTQGTVYNLEGVQLLEEMNLNRVILARELSIDEIKGITNYSDMEIEVFVHGALCIGYSGQCLLSSLIGGRSGNRGKCAQPCRLPYQIMNFQNKPVTEKSYLMSPKDLASVNLLPQLIEAGVISLKVEGRMKSPEYVAAVARTYRKYLDLTLKGEEDQISQEDYKILMQVFNRNGFTTGYLEEKKGYDLISRESPKHWGVLAGQVLSYNVKTKCITVKLVEAMAMGDGVEVRNECLPGNIVTYMTCKGKPVNTAQAGDTVVIGEIKGSVFIGDKIYKITDKKINKELQTSFTSNSPIKKIPAWANFTARKGKPIQLTVIDDQGNKDIVLSEKLVEDAIKKSVTKEDVLKQLNKTGATSFYFKNCEIEMDENCAIPLSEINALRRKGLEHLQEMRKNKYMHRKAPSLKVNSNDYPNKEKRRLGLSAFLWTGSQLEAVVDEDVDKVMVPLNQWMHEDFRRRIKKLENNIDIMVWLPTVTRGHYDQWLKNNNQKNHFDGISGILIGNLSHIKTLKNVDIPLYGDYSLNVYNSKTIDVYKNLGLAGITLSPELTLQQVRKMKMGDIDVEASVYGRLPLMTSAHCPVGSEIHKKSAACGLCNQPYYLTDRKDKKFPLLLDAVDCKSTILNADKLWVPDLIQPLSEGGVSTFRLYFYDENPKEISQRIRACKDALNHKPFEFKRGSGYTKGHYYRGTE